MSSWFSFSPSKISVEQTKEYHSDFTSDSSTSFRYYHSDSPDSVVPNSPNKKIKLNHLPDFSRQTNIMSNSKIHPVPTLQHKKRFKSKRIVTPFVKPQKSSGWTSFFISYLFKIFICYLSLSYFYWCPQDPTKNPIVCRNLAQLHWALEPHVSPYLDQFNHHVRSPIRIRFNRKLRPIYNNYLIPVWNQVSPQVSKALIFLKHSFQKSKVNQRVNQLENFYFNPLLRHVKTRYEQKLLPHVQLVKNYTNRTYQLIRRSRVIKFLKSHLPQIQLFLLQNLIHPIQLKVLPSLDRFHSNYAQPAIIRFGNSIYQYLFIQDNHLKNYFRCIKLAYRRRLLKPLKHWHAIYIRPQVKKIALKLDEYQNRNNDSIQIDRLNHSTSHNPLFKGSKSPDHSEKPHRSTDQQESSSKVADQTFSVSPELEATDRLDHLPQEEVVEVPNLPTKPIEESHPTPLSDDTVTIEKNVESSTTQQNSDRQSDPMIGEESVDSKTVSDVEELVENELDLDGELDAFYEDDLAEKNEIIDDNVLDATDSLTVDPDEFMEEIKNEIASESETVSEDERAKRKSPERIAQERKRLEKIISEGFEQLSVLKKVTIENFLNAITAKRNVENLRQHEEFTKKDRLIKIEQESEKLIERLEKWFKRNEKSETKKIKEKMSEAELVVKKSKEKFIEKLISPHLIEVEKYYKKEYQNELDILDETAAAASQYSSEIQSELGFGFTWLSDVSYHDWAIYHQFRAEAESIKKTMKEIILNGVKPDLGLNQVPRPDFFILIDHLKSSIDSTHVQFEKKLDLLYRNHLVTLNHRTVKPIQPHSDL